MRRIFRTRREDRRSLCLLALLLLQPVTAAKAQQAAPQVVGVITVSQTQVYNEQSYVGRIQ